jgi:hypothetical protein
MEAIVEHPRLVAELPLAEAVERWPQTMNCFLGRVKNETRIGKRLDEP